MGLVSKSDEDMLVLSENFDRLLYGFISQHNSLLFYYSSKPGIAWQVVSVAVVKMFSHLEKQFFGF